MKRLPTIFAFAMFALTTLRGAVLVGPFAEDVGQWTTLANGDFQLSSMTNWASRCEALGVFAPSGNGAESSVVSSGKGSGFAITQTIAVESVQTYILSGFFYTAALSGHFYLDLDDVSFEPHDDLEGGIGAPAGVGEWQFAWAAFTVPTGVTNVTVRVVQDHWFSVGEHGYACHVAVTPVCDFVPPQTIAAAAKEKDAR